MGRSRSAASRRCLLIVGAMAGMCRRCMLAMVSMIGNCDRHSDVNRAFSEAVVINRSGTGHGSQLIKQVGGLRGGKTHTEFWRARASTDRCVYVAKPYGGSADLIRTSGLGTDRRCVITLAMGASREAAVRKHSAFPEGVSPFSESGPFSTSPCAGRAKTDRILGLACPPNPPAFVRPFAYDPVFSLHLLFTPPIFALVALMSHKNPYNKIQTA